MKLSEVPKGIVISLGVGILLSLAVLVILPEDKTGGWVVGYGLGLITILLHFTAARAFSTLSDNNFFSIYFLSIGLRFLVVIAIFILIIIFGKIDQISFTVSFIISYIFHSVIEIILLNIKLTNRAG